ncbi:MAG: PilT/PilU family type 4a pilus ATPase [Acidobacteriota bacterium]
MSTLNVDSLLKLAVVQDASDLHLVAGNPPRLRINGELGSIDVPALSAQDVRELVDGLLGPEAKEMLEARGQVDISYEVPDLARFRVNAFVHFGGLGAVVRVVPSEVIPLDTLKLPPVVGNLCRRRSGFVLVTGATGSGKSTTLTAMVDRINDEREGHVVLIEQPIEAVHKSKRCLVSQREVGVHTTGFTSALRSALRQDPDVVVLGEMRDRETIRLAVTAAEMGTLVIGTLHTAGAIATIDRIVNVFPAVEQPYIRGMLSTSLSGVVSQALLKRIDGGGRVAAVEVLINNSAVANLIREGKFEQLESVIQAGGLQGMQSFDNAVRKLLDARLIGVDEACRVARKPEQFAHLKTRRVGAGGDSK